MSDALQQRVLNLAKCPKDDITSCLQCCYAGDTGDGMDIAHSLSDIVLSGI
jgi:hypothetical protein